MHDNLGDRMKENFENRTRYFLPRRTYSIIRIDGKSFHNYTAKMDRPFDDAFMHVMDGTARLLCEHIQGAQFAYVQSDEISILLTDFEKITTQAFFEGNIQKICSVSASMATAYFNVNVFNIKRFGSYNNFPDTQALFDSRVFTIPDQIEVYNYFVWRQNDATRNSITSAAQSLYSHKELNGKNSAEKQEMIFQKGQNWNNYPDGCKRGRIIKKEEYILEPQYITPIGDINQEKQIISEGAVRSHWVVVDPPVFTKEKEFLKALIPTMPKFEEDAI